MPGLVNHWTLHGTAPAPRLWHGTCRSPEEPLEAHHFASALSSEVTWSLGGLLADTSYVCEWRESPADEAPFLTHRFTTQPLPAGLPVFKATGDPNRGYTAFNHWTRAAPDPNRKVVIVDGHGRVRWYRWLPEHGAAIDVEWTEDDLFLIGGGPRFGVAWYTPDGRQVARIPDRPYGDGFHHHAAAQPDGTVLTLVDEPNTLGDDTWLGFGVLNLTRSGEEVWSWHSQQAVDAGQLPTGTPREDDPYHANSATLLTDDHGEALWLSLRNLDALVRVDVQTGSITHTLQQGGDFALYDEDGNRTLGSDAWFSGQHAPEFHWPRVLMHDNGSARNGGAGESRALELELDLAAHTAQVTWQWSDGGWWERLFGDADRLPNGNVLVSRGRCWEVQGCPGAGGDPTRISNLIEIAPTTGDVVWRLDFPDQRDSVYRAERIAPCELWSNAAYCHEGFVKESSTATDSE